MLESHLWEFVISLIIIIYDNNTSKLSYQKINEDFSCESVLSLMNGVRFAGVCSKNGFIDFAYKEGINPLVSMEHLEKSGKDTIQVFGLLAKNLGYMGDPEYFITSYENIKRVTFLLDEEFLLLVSFEKKVSDIELVSKIINYLTSNHFFGC